MSLQGTIRSAVIDAMEFGGKFLSTNGHAQQAIPAMHRLSAAGGMYLGWKAGDKVRDSVFGMDQISEGEFIEKKREDISAPLRFLHHSIDWNPHSDAPKDQWKKIVYQAMPAIGATIGTVSGSLGVFQFNGRAANFAKYNNPKTPLSLMQADEAAQYAQAKWPLFATSLFGGASAASMLVVPYGIGLNENFKDRIGNAVNLLNRSGGNLGPAKALAERLAKVPFYVKSAENSGGKLSKDWANIFVKRTFKIQFPNELSTPEKEAEYINDVHNAFEKIYKECEHLKGEERIKAVSEKMKAKFGDASPIVDEKGKHTLQGYDKYVKEDTKLKAKNFVPGNASPRMRKMHDGIAKKTGIGIPSESYQKRVMEQWGESETIGTGGRGR